MSPEYFNTPLHVEGEMIIGQVNNDTGQVVVYNPITKKLNQRTPAQIVTDLSLMTTYNFQNIYGIKSFGGGFGNAYNEASLETRGGGTANPNVYPTLSFHQGGLYAATLSFRGDGFHFMDIYGTTYAHISANGFVKGGSDDSYVLLGGGGHKPVSEFVAPYQLDQYWKKYELAGYTGINTPTPFAFLNGGGAQKAYMGGLLVSDYYSDSVYIPNNGAYIKGLLLANKGLSIPFAYYSGLNIPHVRKNPLITNISGTGAMVIKLPVLLTDPIEKFKISFHFFKEITQTLRINNSYNNINYSLFSLENNTGQNDVVSKVRLATTPDNKSCIILNEIDSSWSYIQVIVDEYVGGSLPATMQDWSVSIVQDLSGYNDMFSVIQDKSNKFLKKVTKELNYNTLNPTSTKIDEIEIGISSYNNNSGYGFGDYIHFGASPGGGNGYRNLLMLNKNGFGIRQYLGDPDSTTAYTNHVDYWNTGNFNPDNKVNKSGDTMSGGLKIDIPNGVVLGNGWHLNLTASNLDNTNFSLLIPESNRGQLFVGNANYWGSLDLQPFGGDATLRGESIATKPWVNTELNNYIPLSGTSQFTGGISNSDYSLQIGKVGPYKAILGLSDYNNPNYNDYSFYLNGNIEEGFSTSSRNANNQNGYLYAYWGGIYMGASDNSGSANFSVTPSGCFGDYKIPILDGSFVQRKYLTDNYVSQSQFNPNDFVKTTGMQLISGNKEFVNTVLASGGISSANGANDEVFIGDASTAGLKTEIVNEGSEIRLKPNEYDVPGSGYLEVIDNNRLIRIFGENEKQVVHLKKVFPRQTYKIYNSDPTALQLDIQINGILISQINSGFFQEIYIRDNLKPVIEAQQQFF